MFRIPFIEAQFFDPAETRNALEVRFARHLRQLRGRGHEEEDISADAAEEPGEEPLQSPIQLSGEDYARIQRRVRAILERRKAVSGLDHLRREDHERLEVLRHGAQLISLPTEHRADELASALHGDMPWMGTAAEIVWRAMRRSVREGWGGLRLLLMQSKEANTAGL